MRTTKKDIRELEESAREYLDPRALLYAVGERDATRKAYAIIGGEKTAYRTNTELFDAIMRMIDAQSERMEQAYTAARALIDAYAEAIGEHPTDDDPETRAALRVARFCVAGRGALHAGDRETVAAMVEAIAERTHAAEAIEDAREAWTGPDCYRIAYSDGPAYGEARYYETAEDLARDLASAYQSATETHLPYAERHERPTYQPYELEAFLGEPDAYDVDAIEAEATAYDPRTGARVWTAFGDDLAAIAERHAIA